MTSKLSFGLCESNGVKVKVTTVVGPPATKKTNHRAKISILAFKGTGKGVQMHGELAWLIGEYNKRFANMVVHLCGVPNSWLDKEYRSLLLHILKPHYMIPGDAKEIHALLVKHGCVLKAATIIEDENPLIMQFLCLPHLGMAFNPRLTKEKFTMLFDSDRGNIESWEIAAASYLGTEEHSLVQEVEQSIEDMAPWLHYGEEVGWLNEYCYRDYELRVGKKRPRHAWQRNERQAPLCKREGGYDDKEFLSELRTSICRCYARLILEHLGMKPEFLERFCDKELLEAILYERGRYMDMHREHRRLTKPEGPVDVGIVELMYEHAHRVSKESRYLEEPKTKEQRKAEMEARKAAASLPIPAPAPAPEPEPTSPGEDDPWGYGSDQYDSSGEVACLG